MPDTTETIASGPTQALSMTKSTLLVTMNLFGSDLIKFAPAKTNLRIASITGGVNPSLQTGAFNLSIAPKSGAALTSGNSNLSIGQGSLESQKTGNATIAVGVASAQFGTALFDCTYVGTKTGRFAKTGTGDTGFGFRVLEKATIARNNTGVGDSALWQTQGAGNVAAGYRAAEYVRLGDDSVYIGRTAGVNRSNGTHVILIGSGAGSFNGVVRPDINTGLPTVDAGDRIIGIGVNSLKIATGSDHVAVGDSAGGLFTTAEGSIAIGSGAGNVPGQKPDVVNSISIGTNSITTKDNQAVIGAETITETVLRGVVSGTVYSVASLPSPMDAGSGARAFISDSASITFGEIAVAGGVHNVPVFSDGVNWRVG